jgi:hypothetical protein
MRLRAVENGHRPLQRLQLAMLRLLAGRVSGPVLLMSYRRDHFGRWLAVCLQQSMRRSPEWRIAETELFAAFVSKLNRCVY